MRIRFVLGAAVAVTSALAVATAAFAAGGGFGSPGTTRFHDLSASAEFSDNTGATMFISADYGMQTFKLRGVNGAPFVVGPETVLNFSGNLADGTPLGGCWVIPDSSFKVASGLASATLDVDPTVESPCQGIPIAAANGGRLGLKGVVPDAGGGGGGGIPVTAHIVWSSNGAITTSSIAIETRCQTGTSHTTGSTTSTPAVVTGGISLMPDSTGQFGSIYDSSTMQVISATFASACFTA